MDRNTHTYQCRVCGAVCTRVRTPNTTILVDEEPELIQDSKGGPDVGYTLNGRRVEGYWIKKGEKYVAAWEVHRIHLCAHTQAMAAASGR